MHWRGLRVDGEHAAAGDDCAALAAAAGSGAAAGGSTQNHVAPEVWYSYGSGASRVWITSVLQLASPSTPQCKALIMQVITSGSSRSFCCLERSCSAMSFMALHLPSSGGGKGARSNGT